MNSQPAAVRNCHRSFPRVSRSTCLPRSATLLLTLSLTIALAESFGCARCLRPNPFVDDFACEEPVTTPSVRTARSVQTERRQETRDWQPIARSAADGAVQHAPLYFEDPFEDKGSQDGRLAWTSEDYLQLFYWRGRFLVNLIAFPLSAVATPPWTVMESDGFLSRQALGCDHDAAPLCCHHHHALHAAEQ